MAYVYLSNGFLLIAYLVLGSSLLPVHTMDPPTPPSTPAAPSSNGDPCEYARCYHYCNVTSNGDAQCGCYNGYRLYRNRRSCIDIDECSEYESGGCYHYCHNTPGSYYCSCQPGYYLNDDGLYCSHGDVTYPASSNGVPYQSADSYNPPEHHDPGYNGAEPYPPEHHDPAYYPDHTVYPEQLYPSDPTYYQPPPSEYIPQRYPGSHTPYHPPEYGHQVYPHQGYPEYQIPYYQPPDVPYHQQYPDPSYHSQSWPHSRPYRTTLGDDPHFAVLLPSGLFLCYSVQGEHNKVFNLISNPDVHINALFIPDAKREEVTWIGSLGIVTHPRHSGHGNLTYISFSTDNSSITVTRLVGEGEEKQWRTVSLKSTHVASISLSNGEMYVTHHTGNKKQPTVEVTLSDVKLNFTVKFDGSHLDMFWQEVGEQPELSHGLIGQFFRRGVEIDEVRKMLIIPRKEPVPIMRRPIWSFMERENNEDIEFCWTAMNSGFQGRGLIDGMYLDYQVSNVLSTDFSPASVHRREHGRNRKL